MKRALPILVSRLILSAAVLMFLIAGASFNHALESHDHHSHDHAEAVPHDHTLPDLADTGFSDLQTVHCGANLLALTCETEPVLPAPLCEPETGGTSGAVSKTAAVDPPPPRPSSLLYS